MKTKRDSAFYIDGGAGRVIAAIPALEKYAKNNPDDNFIVIIPGWDFLMWGNALLQDRTYSADTKGLFENQIKNRQVYTPEPYRVFGYYNQELSLAEAFDEEINNTEDHRDIGVPSLYLSKAEEKGAANLIADVKSQQKKQKTIVIQPYGRSARVDRGDIIDDSSRGLDSRGYMSLIKKLATKFNLILFAEKQFHQPEDTYTFKPEADLRFWSAIIEASDYFVGVDSVGQHIARAFHKPGTVIMGSTFAKNVSYPDWFNIIEKKDTPKKYSPIRICGMDNHLADRYNDRLMDFTEKEIDDIFMSIVSDIDKKVK